MEAISSQGVKRATGAYGWFEAAPSLDCLVSREDLFLQQKIAHAQNLDERPHSVMGAKSLNASNDPTFRGGKIMSQRPGRPTTALPKVWSDVNPWSENNGAIERNRFSSRLKI